MPASAVLTPTELVRASIGFPTTWAVCVYLDGGAPTLASIVTVSIRPGLGISGSGLKGMPFSLQAGATTYFTRGPERVPATELIIEVSNSVAANVAYRVVAVAAPISWLPEVPERRQW